MSIAFKDATELNSAEWASREQVIRRFEDAWRHGSRPILEDYLPASERDRRTVLLELVHTELEYRLKDGAPARVEEYLVRFPELTSEPEAALELITAELELRRRREPGLMLDEFLVRFPRYQRELLSMRRRMHETGATPPLRRICPQCHEPLDVFGDAARESVACPSCGATIRLDLGRLASRSQVQSRLGKYELQEELGRGAFGVVYRARDTDLDRTVALKVPRAGRLATDEEVDRFLREARSAAQLDHPHIVAIHDFGRAGETCYLACAFVPGTTLAQSMAAGRLPFRETAVLVARVAEALHYAHRQGVVHRDVKPANILLDRQAEPHLTDFGLAKREAGEITLTLDGEALGTPAYMSPEQARGESHRVDGRSDIYSLGVVLYQMLTGELPFRGNPRMVQKQVLEAEPQSPRRLNDRIPRDLATICLKCLEKEPARRYASADTFADDLRRFWNGEPILARPVGWMERAGRWCRRKPLVASLLAALTLAVFAGFAGVTWQWLRTRREWTRAEANFHLARGEWNRAEANFRLARQAVDDYFNRVSQNKLLDVPGMQPLRKELLETALEYYQGFVKERADDRALQAELADAYFKMGFINDEIGSKAEALSAYQMALATYQKLAGEHPDDPELRRLLARTYHNLGYHYRSVGQIAGALRSLQQAVETHGELAREHPENTEIQTRLAASHHNLGVLHFQTGHPAEALGSVQRATAILEELIRAGSAVAQTRGDLAQFYITIGAVRSETGHPSEARGPWQRAVEILKGLTRDHPNVRDFRRDLAGSIMNIGSLELDANHPAEAIRHFGDALHIQEKLHSEDPAVLDFQRDLGQTYTMLGSAYTTMGRPAEALHPLEQARDLRAKLVRSDPAALDYQSELGSTLHEFGGALAGLGRRPEALAAFQQAIHLQRGAMVKAPLVVQYRNYLGNHYKELAALERSSGHPAEAATAVLERRELWPNDPAELFSAARDLALCMPLVGNDARGLTAAQQAERRKYADLAIDTLRQAIVTGFKDAERLRSDPDLDRLRSRQDFQLIVGDLTFPSNPFAR